MMIRSAQPSDLDEVQALLDACELPHEDLTPAHLDHFLVAGGDEGLHGVVGLEPYGEVALLRSLAVAPSARYEGLGTRLVNAIEQRARENEVCTLYLLTTTAAEYFRNCGYANVAHDALPEAIQQTEEAARLCPSSATCMRKTLSRADAEPQIAG